MNTPLQIDAKNQETVSLYRHLLEIPQVLDACREVVVGKETKENARALLEPLLQQQGDPLEGETGQLHLPDEADYTLLWCLLTKDFRQQTVTCLDFSRLELDEARFQEASLITVSLAGCSLKEANFEKATLRAVDCSSIMAPNSTWNNVSATEVRWNGAYLWEASFSLREATSVWWADAYLEGSVFGGSLQRAVFTNASLRRTRFDHADLSYADFNRATMNEVDSESLCANHANFTGALLAMAELSHSSLQGAIFSHAKMPGVNLAHADISHALFVECDLSGAVLEGSNATHSTFTGARLHQVNFEGVNIAHAALGGAFFYGASFNYAVDVEEAHFGDTFHIDGSTVIPEDSHVLISQLLSAQAKTWEQYRLAAAVRGGARFGLCWSPIFLHVLEEPALLPWIREVLSPVQSLRTSVAKCERHWRERLRKNWEKGRIDGVKNDDGLGDHPF